MLRPLLFPLALLWAWLQLVAGPSGLTKNGPEMDPAGFNKNGPEFDPAGAPGTQGLAVPPLDSSG